MYELFVALKYLIPKKRAISTSVISLIAFAVISLVVWLVLIFLSVTAGLEQNWLNKLTSLNAPLRITPTDEYYKSYYYLVDNLASESFYETKTIGEKNNSNQADPYLSDSDIEVPYYWNKPDLDNNGKLKDLVKIAYREISDIKKDFPTLEFQDYEASGAFMRLSLNRCLDTSLPQTSFVSQMTYILSLSEKNPNLSNLLLKPSAEDIENLLTYKSEVSLKDRIAYSPVDTSFNQNVLENIQIRKVQLRDSQLPYHLLPEKVLFYVEKLSEIRGMAQILLKNNGESNTQIIRLKDKILYIVNGQVKKNFDIHSTILHTEEPICFDVESTENETFFIRGSIQNAIINEKLPLRMCKLTEIRPIIHFESDPKFPPPWVYFVKNKGYVLPKLNSSYGILLPRSFKKNHVLIGDNGYFGFSSASSTSSKEMRAPFYVAGFYDPGVFPLGNRFLIAPIELVRIINSSSFVSTSEITNNGLFIWNTPLKDAKKIKSSIEAGFIDKKIDKYWKVETYEDFDFSKDLLQQFQSDKLLFSLVAIIILMVACSNIISMLILLVNDKKKEIAILMSLGATKKSISLIFGACGFITGFLSSTIGTILAIFTLEHIDSIAAFLSRLQGHQAFNTAFFGSSLPNSLSSEALLFILITTPVISLLAGIIPALKAANLNPARTLRS